MLQVKFLAIVILMFFGFFTGAIAQAQGQKIQQLGNASAPQNGTFYYNLRGEPPTLNPITMGDAYGFAIRGYVVDSLLGVNVDTYEMEPGLAESYEISKDGMTFTFKLRAGAKFHDGKPVTTEDVKFSYDAIFDPTYNAASLRTYFESIDKVEIVDPLTIRFVAKKKYFKNLEVISQFLKILPKHIYADAKKGVKLNKVMIGSGPYKIEKYEQGQRITLVKNKDWWGSAIPEYKGRNNFEKLVFRFVKDENVALEMMKKGQVDYDTMSAEIYSKKAVGPEWGKSVFKVKVENKSPKSYGFIGWNLNNPVFKEKEVRIALAHLMNRQLMIDKFRYGMSVLAAGPWYVQSEFADPSVKPFAFDPKKAGELLLKAGWKDSDKDGTLDKVIDGKKVDFTFSLSHANKDTEKYYTIFKEDLRKAGINMSIKLLEWNAFSKIVDDMNFDAVAMAWGAGSVEVDPTQIWHSSSAVKGGSNFVSYKNAEVDKLLDQGRQELDKKKRIAIYRKVYKQIAEDAPYAWLFNNKFELYGHTSNVQKPKETFVYDIGTDFWWSAK